MEVVSILGENSVHSPVHLPDLGVPGGSEGVAVSVGVSAKVNFEVNANHNNVIAV